MIEIDEKKKGANCPMCGRFHDVKNMMWINGKCECITVCKCGYTSFLEIYRQSVFRDE